MSTTRQRTSSTSTWGICGESSPAQGSPPRYSPYVPWAIVSAALVDRHEVASRTPAPNWPALAPGGVVHAACAALYGDRLRGGLSRDRDATASADRRGDGRRRARACAQSRACKGAHRARAVRRRHELYPRAALQRELDPPVCPDPRRATEYQPAGAALAVRPRQRRE